MNHPGFVGIPDARATGVRSYREKDQPHPLQTAFLDPDGERTYVEALRALLAGGRADEAAQLVERDLAGFDGGIARIALATSAESVSLDGWEDLNPILAEFEGPAITAITIGMTNEPDLVFEAGRLHEPAVLLGLYSDEAFDFTRASQDALLDACASDMPAWAGHEEDVEFYVDLVGLAELNTALIQCKHRHFLRDGRDGVNDRAPGGYVEFVLGCWLRAARFLQALERAARDHGLPQGCRLIAGTVGLHTDFATVIESGRRVALDRASEPRPVAALTIKKWVPRPDPTLETEASGSALRQKLQAPQPAAPEMPAEKAGMGAFSQPAPALIIPSVAPPASNPPSPLPAANVDDVQSAAEAHVPACVPAQERASAVQDTTPRRGFFARLFRRRAA